MADPKLVSAEEARGLLEGAKSYADISAMDFFRLARTVISLSEERASWEAESRAMVARLELVHRALDAAGVPMDPPEVRIAAVHQERDEARRERDELLVKFTGMDAAGWEQEEKEHAAFLLAENRGGGVVMCPTCGRGSFVDGEADIDLSPRICFLCEFEATKKERDRLRLILACERGEWAPEGWEWTVDVNCHGFWFGRTVSDAQGWPTSVRRMTTKGWSHDGGRTVRPTALDAIEAADRAAEEVKP